MTKLRGLIATTHPTIDGRRFTEEALADMAKAELPLPVCVEFNRNAEVGNVTRLWLEADGLHAEIVVGGKTPLLRDNYFGCPGIWTQSGREEMSDAHLQDVGLTTKPADPTLTPLEEDPS